MRSIPIAILVAALVAGCATSTPLATAPQATCAALAAPVDAALIALPTRGATIDSSTLMTPSALAVAERGPNPAATITPAAPEYCKVLGRIAPMDANAPPILFEVNLPTAWNGRSVQYGGGGFNGALISGLGLVPAARFDQPSPLAQGFATYGTDSGHAAAPGQPPQAFALNDEALTNFAHASYKKVRDAAVELMKRAYGRAPQRMYYVGSSEGGREGLTMAQRYPKDYDGIFSRAPVIGFTGLQLAGARGGIASMGDAWLRPAQVKLVADAVLATCDGADGLGDGVVSNAAACRQAFDITRLRCGAGASGDGCLNDAQIRAVQTLHSPLPFPFAFANGVTEYPGWGISGEAAPAYASTGGWNAWWLGTSAPTLPPQPTNGIAWIFGSGTVQYLLARDPKADPRAFDLQAAKPRVLEVSALLDSTNPDLSAFREHGGKLIMLEHLADYAQSPYMGIGYFDSVVSRLGRAQVDDFMRLYTAPGVDHVGAGAPANVDMLAALVAWVERGDKPAGLELVEQSAKPPFAVSRARPLCEWPTWPRYKGGDSRAASSFDCVQ